MVLYVEALKIRHANAWLGVLEYSEVREAEQQLSL